MLKDRLLSGREAGTRVPWVFSQDLHYLAYSARDFSHDPHPMCLLRAGQREQPSQLRSAQTGQPHFSSVSDAPLERESLAHATAAGTQEDLQVRYERLAHKFLSLERVCAAQECELASRWVQPAPRSLSVPWGRAHTWRCAVGRRIFGSSPETGWGHSPSDTSEPIISEESGVHSRRDLLPPGGEEVLCFSFFTISHVGYDFKTWHGSDQSHPSTRQAGPRLQLRTSIYDRTLTGFRSGRGPKRTSR